MPLSHARSIRQIETASPVNAFIAGRQARQEYEYGERRNRLADLDAEYDAIRNEQAGEALQSTRRLNALAADPNATPEAFARAGQPGIAQGINGAREFDYEAKHKAAMELAGVAKRALAMKDPMQRRAFIRDATNAYAPSFQALGIDLTKSAADLDALPDDQLEARLAQTASLIPDEPQYETIQGPGGSILQRNPKDGTLKQVLGREPQSRGLNVTLPDGTTISEGGAQPFGLPKTTQNKAGEDFSNALAGMQRLQGIVASMRPEYLTFAGQAKGTWQGFKARAPEVFGKLSPQEQQNLQGYQTWRSDTLNNLNLYIKEITGAAMSEAEAGRIRAVMPSTEDDPVTFQSKLDAGMKRLSLVAARSAYLLANPTVSLGSVPLERMQLIITDRANALYSGYLQQGLDEREARQRAVAEASQQYGLSQ